MNDLQQVVDELRFILQREVLEKSDELIGYVEQYSSFCHETNARLRRCDECLRQGLRSEALHLADANPNLLDAVAILDFPERQDLIDLLNMYFLKPPEPLLLDVAAGLNAAYAEHEPLERLLNLHRLLAVGRAPLPQRLKVLRSLAELDASSFHWADDVREMERARIQELSAQIQTAARAGQTEVLKAITAELQSPDWYEEVPVAFLRDVRTRATQSIRDSARLRMAEINEHLHAAFSALDTTAARKLRTEWQEKQQIIRATDSDPLCEQVRPIFDWLEDADRTKSAEHDFAKLVTEVEQMLDKDHLAITEMERLQRSIERFDRSLPTTLNSRFQSRLNAIQVNDGRRKTAKVVAILVTVVIAVGTIVFLVQVYSESAKSKQVVASISALIDDGNLTDAKKLVDQYGLYALSPDWQDVKKRLSHAEQSEVERVARWNGEVERARASTELNAMETAIKAARDLARTTDEKLTVNQLQTDWQKRSAQVVDVRERKVRELIALATLQLKELDVELQSGKPIGEVKLLLSKADATVGELLPLSASISKELTSQIALVEGRSKAARQAVDDLSRREQLIERLTDATLMPPDGILASTKEGRYETTLREFATALPNDPRSPTMKTAADISPIASALASMRLVQRWRRMKPTDPKDVETRLKDVRAFLMTYPQSPDRERLKRYESWLTSIARRAVDNGDPDEGVRQRLHRLFNSKLIKDGHVLHDKQGNTYYLAKEQKTPFGSVAGFNYLIGFNGESVQISMKPDDLLTQTSVAPPQQELAAKVRVSVQNIPIDGWRDYFQELSETLMKADRLDPFLRYLLILKTIDFAGQGDSLLEEELAPVLHKLNDDEIDRSVAWMDPKSNSAAKARTRAREVLTALPPIMPLFANATRRYEQFERQLMFVRYPVGWLDNDPVTGWKCRTKWTPNGEFALWGVTRPDAAGTRSWIRIGRAERSEFTIDQANAPQVGEAGVIFASVMPPDTTDAESQ